MGHAQGQSGLPLLCRLRPAGYPAPLEALTEAIGVAVLPLLCRLRLAGYPAPPINLFCIKLCSTSTNPSLHSAGAFTGAIGTAPAMQAPPGWLPSTPGGTHKGNRCCPCCAGFAWLVTQHLQISCMGMSSITNSSPRLCPHAAFAAVAAALLLSFQLGPASRARHKGLPQGSASRACHKGLPLGPASRACL